MEKRYLIKEQGECDPGIVLTGTITESELDSRLIAIYKLVRWGLPDREGMFLENAKNILLNGTEKEQEVAHITKCTCERCTGIAVESLYEEQSQCPSGNPSMVYTEKEQPIILSRAEPVPATDDVDWPDPEDIIKMRDKPAKPTRKEWEVHAVELAEKHVSWHLESMRQFGIDNFVHGYKHRMEEENETKN